MKLASDYSNLNDFAFFVGAQIQEPDYGSNKPTIITPDNRSWLRAGECATIFDDGVYRFWGKDEFEELFNVEGDLEQLPEGFSPDLSDDPKYGEVIIKLNESDLKAMISIVRTARASEGEKEKRFMDKLNALTEKIGLGELSADEISSLSVGFYCQPDEPFPTYQVVYSCVGEKYNIVKGATVAGFELQAHYNRKALRR